MIDLTKLIIDTTYSAFKQNTIYTGSLTISGSTVAGTNTRTFTITLTKVPDMVDLVFNGPVGGIETRPASAWFKQGYVWVPTNNAGGGNPSNWQVSGAITGSTTLTITAAYVQTFSTAEVLTSTNFSYRLIDYSVF